MANITRIKNNQITDQTIEYTKIKPGTLVGTVFNANITLNSNVTIVGNLDVSGTTTTVQSTNTYINDPLVIFNNGFASTPAYDIGILVNRNLTATAPYGSVNAALVWQEAAKGFAGVMTTETGTTAGAINNSGYANLFIGNIYANTITVRDTVDSTSKTTGAVVIAGGLGVTKTMYANAIEGTPIGALVPNTGNFTTITTGGLQAAAIGNATPGTGAFTTLTSNDQTTFTSATDSTTIGDGAVQIYGGLSVAKNISASSAVITTLVATNYSTANAVITGGYADNFPIGANVEAPGRFSTLVTTSTTWHAGNLVANSQTTSTSTTTGALVVVGGAGISGNLNVGSNPLTDVHMIRGNVIIATNPTHEMADTWFHINGSTSNAQLISALAHFQGIDGVSAKVAIDTNANTSTFSSGIEGRRARGTAGSPTAAQQHDQLFRLGARGFGATGYLSTATNPSPVSINFNAAENYTDTAQGTYIELLTTPNGSVNPVARVKVDQTGNVVITQTTDSTTTATGALVVAGGVGIARKLTVGEDAFIGGNLTVQGDLTYINTSTLTVEDTILELNTGSNGAALSTATINDVGVRARYYDTTERSAFFGRARDTGFFEYFSLASETAGNITGTYGTIKSGEMLVANSTNSTSTTSGALQVTGGAAIGANLYVGGEFYLTNQATLNSSLTVEGVSNLKDIVYIIQNTPAVNTTSGALQVTGGVSTQGALFAGGNIVAASGTTSTSSTTGALTVIGGAGISGDIFTGARIVSGGNVVANSGTATTNTTTGALVVNGGVGVSGAIITGGNIVAGSGTASTSTTTGALVVVGGAGVSGNVTVGGAVDVAGDIYVQGADIISGVATFNLLNVNTTTINAFGAATEINTGNASGTTNMSGIVKVGGNLVAISGTNSTSPTTGAVVINSNGGLGVTGNVFLANAVVINSTKTAGQDFLVKGNTNETLIWARPNSTYDQVLIGNSASVSDLVQGAKLQINSTDSMLLPTGTSAQRPSSVGFADVTGMLRYNTTLGYIEFYTGTDWDGVTTQFTVITSEQLNGDGSEVNFTLGGPTTSASTIVSINGVVQIPTLAYSITGANNDVLTFTEAPSVGDVIDVRRLTTTQNVLGIASTNGFMQFQTDNNGAYVYTGSSGTAATTYWDPSGAMVNSRANVTVASSGVATTIDSFFANTYSSGEYTITATIQGTNIREIAKLIVVHDNTTAYRNVYGVISTSGNALVNYTTTVSSGSVLLRATTTDNNTIFKIAKNYQAL